VEEKSCGNGTGRKRDGSGFLDCSSTWGSQWCLGTLSGDLEDGYDERSSLPVSQRVVGALINCVEAMG
jgi:hypothetical protein